MAWPKALCTPSCLDVLLLLSTSSHRAVRRFAEQISRDLPPPGTLRNEAMSRHLNLKWQVAVTRYEWTTFSVLLKVMSQITGSS